MKLPVLFIGHGSPLNAVQDSAYTEEWQNYGDELLDEYDGEIEAVLCISSQWQSEGSRVTASAKPPTLHNFAGFPDELYQVSYPAPGSPDTAERVRELLGADIVQPDPERGLDYGAWAVLKRLIPDASVPVVQLSLDSRLDARGHFELAGKLAPLRREGVLILASGNTVSNLAMHDWQNPLRPGNAYPWADLARELINKWITGRRYERLLDENGYPAAVRQAVHDRRFFYPLLYALALRGDKETLEFFNDETVGRSVAMTSFVIGFL